MSAGRPLLRHLQHTTAGGVTALLPTRKVVSDCWDAYTAPCSAATLDPLLMSDSDFISARDRAHKRWSEAFVKWDGR